MTASFVTHGRHCPCSACAKEDWTRCGRYHRRYVDVSGDAWRCTACGWTGFDWKREDA